jgi:23S rRNA pseudouridine1911/1915/1917 synthase
MSQDQKPSSIAPDSSSASNNGQPQTLVVAEGESGVRLDRWLAERLPEHSRSYIQKLIKDGAIRSPESGPLPARHKVSAGETFAVEIPELVDVAPQPEDIPLEVAYEDEHLIVVNKPSGIATHPSAGHATGTLVNALVHHCGDSLSGINGEKRPGIVHRLDVGTSGLLICAKSDDAHRPLAEALRSRDIKRVYLALVQGEPAEDAGEIESYLGRDPRNRLRRAVVPKKASDARHARTLWKVHRRYRGAALLRVKLETGRTHQVRVHLAWKSRPVVGDELYGYKPGALISQQQPHAQTLLRATLSRLDRPFLHAWRLAFAHPITGEVISLEAPIPPDLQHILDRLEELAR